MIPLQKKVTFVVSFRENSLFLFEEMKKQGRTEKVVFLEKNNSAYIEEHLEDVTALKFETGNLFAMVRSIYHLATSEHVIIDNYYGFLAATNFKKEVQVVQLWHAVGAIKSFGLKDLTIKDRSKIAKRRFRLVYQKFQNIVVGSDEMARIFMHAFNVDEGVILRTGIPRTDIFFDAKKQNKVKSHLIKENPTLQKKKVILYAPTYRDDHVFYFDLKLNIGKLYEQLHKDYVLLLKLHPIVKNDAENFEKKYEGFVFDYTYYPSVNDLLLVTDVLITDYSSIHYEFSLLRRPIVFYAYDEESYRKKRGLIGDYAKEIPGPIARSTDEIIHFIKEYPIDSSVIDQFAHKWNEYSKGDASARLVDYMFDKEM